MTDLPRVMVGGLLAMLLVMSSIGADEVKELGWEDLLPKAKVIEPGKDDKSLGGNTWGNGPLDDAFASPVYPTGVVEELDGQLVKIPGFVVPLEIEGEGKVKEFLLVPYYGACVHYPPPPPNQLVYVTFEEAIEFESIWDPIWATGKLKTELVQSDLGSAGYSMVGQTVEVYEY